MEYREKGRNYNDMNTYNPSYQPPPNQANNMVYANKYRESERDNEMHTFTPIAAYKPAPLKPFDGHDNDKERRNKDKEKRISVSIVILSFLASVCVLFGTLYPELLRSDIDMDPWRSLIQASVRKQGWLIRDKVTLVNIGLWRYCYDDQLYDLIEVVNPQFGNLGRRRRSAEEEEENSIEKRQAPREGAFDIRCHNLPKPWKMPHYLINKLLATKITLIIGVVSCILTFLISILTLITRLPFLRFLQLLSCLLAAISISIAVGLCVASNSDVDWYFNESLGRSLERILREDFDLDFGAMSINLKSADLVSMNVGVSFIFVVGACFVMIVATVLAELSRNLS